MEGALWWLRGCLVTARSVRPGPREAEQQQKLRFWNQTDQGSKPAVLLSRCWGLGRIRKRYHAGVMFPT